jgi:hypothetical protein
MTHLAAPYLGRRLVCPAAGHKIKERRAARAWWPHQRDRVLK